MHAVVRTYTGAKAKPLFDLLEERRADVEKTMRGVSGLISYTAARTADGGVTVTVCKDKSGAEESLRVAREWVAKNAGGGGASVPEIAEGAVILHLG